MLICEELSRLHLSPSCIIYNIFSFHFMLEQYSIDITFQEVIEIFFTSITNINEILFPLLETEADATITYLLPNLSWINFKRNKMLYILRKTILDYIALMSQIHTHIRFVSIKHPIKYFYTTKEQKCAEQSAKLDKHALELIHILKG